MSKKSRYFKCGSCSNQYERLVEDDVKVIECECGSKAARMIAAPRMTGNTTGRSASFSNRK